MKIALDYDETFTNDPELWISFVINAKNNGHSVSFVTYRNSNWNNSDIEEYAKILDICIVFSNGRQKAEVFDADVWIDDKPVNIPNIIDIEKLMRRR